MAPGYAEALWRAHPHMNESADFVMYWWDRAAELLTRKKTPLRRFGFVTTNSISQVFQRRVMERHLNGKPPLSIIFAVPDHPWTKATKDSAAVRIAMTAVRSGSHEGELREIASEAELDTDNPTLDFISRAGKVNSDLTLGVDVNRASPLLANKGLCVNGMKPLGAGFIVSEVEARHLGLGTRLNAEAHIRPYRNGRDLTAYPRGVYAIDFWGMTPGEVRHAFPEAYQHLLATVKPERDEAARRSPTRDAQEYAERWWTFCKPRQELREFSSNVDRVLVTVQTAKHRIFQFLPNEIMPDQKLMVVGSDSAELMAILSSHIHTAWTLRTCSWLGMGNDSVYVKIRTFDPFPFPNASDALSTTLRDLGEELDATRKTVRAEHSELTLTGLYNVLEKIRAGTPLDARDQDVRERGRVLILKDLHDQIDRATMQAYGWDDLIPLLASSDDQERKRLDETLLERLVALNAERAAEEAAGQVRWLRPDYQIPRFAKGAAARSGQLDLGETVVTIDKSLPVFPKDKGEQAMAIHAVLQAANRPMDAAVVSRAFKGGGKRIEQRVVQALSTLVRYGWITALPGRTYAARRAA